MQFFKIDPNLWPITWNAWREYEEKTWNDLVFQDMIKYLMMWQTVTIETKLIIASLSQLFNDHMSLP